MQSLIHIQVDLMSSFSAVKNEQSLIAQQRTNYDEIFMLHLNAQS